MFLLRFKVFQKIYAEASYSNKAYNEANCCCHDCDFKCEKITELQKHLTKTNNVVFQSERIIFENINGQFYINSNLPRKVDSCDAV